MSHTEKTEECNFCGWVTEELVECDAYARTNGHGPFTPDDEKQWAWLCDLCRNTLWGNAYLYPRNYSNDVYVMGASMNYLANRILEKT